MRFAHELDAGGDEALVVLVEVVDAQEKTHATGVLFADDGGLLRAICPGEHETGFGVGGTHHDPPFRTAVGGHRPRILDELEAEHVNEKTDRGVVVVNDEGNEVDMGHRCSQPSLMHHNATVGYDRDVTSLVPSGPPRGGDIDNLRSRITDLEAALRDRSADVERTKADLAAFRIKYRGDVGLLHEELDELELAIDEAELGELSKRVDEAGDAAADAATDTPIEVLPRSTTEAVRRLFRDLAKAIHPDLAKDERARDRRHSLMIEANKAYALGDEERLRSILQAWENSPEAVQGSDPEAARERLIRRLAQIEAQLAAFDSELAALRESALWKLKAMVDEAAGRGEDLVAEMVRRLKRDIQRARHRLDAIQPRP